MKRLNILVFPCGSEVGLEIFRSLKYSRHIKLLGGSSIDDHGKFVFNDYHGDFPFITSELFLSYLKNFIKKHDVDAIYPAMDSVITILKSHEDDLGCKIISSPKETSLLCASKIKTYEHFKEQDFIPFIYKSLNSVIKYPIFIKPDIGYGSIGAKKINSYEEGIQHIATLNSYVITEYLPGDEYTVDCFTNMNNELIFVGPRPRRRTKSGISVNTISIPIDKRKEFEELAETINSKMDFNGAWFFQVKKNIEGKLKLLEIASRMGGSSSLYRLKGVNFALLSVFNTFGQKVSILENKYSIEIDRALDVRMKLDFDFINVYVDFDDCLVLDNIVNVKLVSVLYEYINQGKKIILITRHEKNITESLKKYRLHHLFDEIIHITNKNEKKSRFIKADKSIFIDDSFVERLDVAKTHNIPVFSPDMIN
jgi:hypothetical protein